MCEMIFSITMFKKIVQLPRYLKIFLMILSDSLILPFAFWTSVALRLGTIDPNLRDFINLFPIIVVTSIPIFIKLGLYRAVIRFVDTRILSTILLGVTMSTLILTASVTMWRFDNVPRTSIFIYWVLATIYLALSRYAAKALITELEPQQDLRKRVAIYGAGRTGLQTVLALFSSKKYLPVAFFDDDSELHNSVVAGVKVYDPDAAEDVVNKKNIKEVLLALPTGARQRRQEIIKNFKRFNVNIKSIPSFQELIAGSVRVEDIREVGIEDILGRDPVPPDQNLLLKCIAGKNILVTGAGGSIGSELCRQIVRLNPKKLVLLDSNEFALYNIHRELVNLNANINIIPKLADITSFNRIDRIIKKDQIHTVYHAAAYKHVPLVEANYFFGLYNNILGTYNCVKSSLLNKIETFVLISSDKAVRPTNYMGVSKRISELVVSSMAQSNTDRATKFGMVRFGNVLGSSGSVLPLFKEQIKNGGPITVTHPEVTRYFMTISEAAQLVMQAGALAQNIDLFLLDMGEPVKILDLAKKMIHFSDLQVFDPITQKGDIEIKITGLRPGEKLFEELLIDNNSTATSHPRIKMAVEKNNLIEDCEKFIEQLVDICYSENDSELEKIVKKIVPEYTKV
jgi:FlaA1/EpsC-like NDP-sugar epimerase